MSLPTVAVTFTAYDQGGQPVAGARVLAKLDQTEIYQGFVVPEQIEVTTDANGVAVLNLWPNALGVAGSKYRVRSWNPDTGAKFLDATISVPNSDCALEQILVQEPYPTVDASERALIAAQGALADVTAQALIASTAATDAQGSAASASGSASMAGTSASQAASSASSASSSAANAAGSATTAGQQAGAATSAAAVALGAADAALVSQNAAANSATSAADSATLAGQHRTQTGLDVQASAASASAAQTAANQASTSASASAQSASAAAGSATTAGQHATSASNSQAAAASRATAASLSESSAAVSANTATTQAQEAASMANIATTKAGEASASATAAANSYDAFDDRYLGAKATAPTVDNDGQALLVGALYWDTSTGAMRAWSGSAWVDVNELNGRVLADQQLLGAVGYATDMALQAVRAEPVLQSQVTSLSTSLASYDAAVENLTYAATHLADLAGVTARAVGGGAIELQAGTAAIPSLTSATDVASGVFFPANGVIALATAALERLRVTADGRLGIGTTAPSGLLDVADNKIRVRTAQTPASATATGNQGEIAWDASYLYVCTATNTWKRAALASW